MNKINISDTAKSIAKAHVEPKSRSAWVLDADVQAAVDMLFISMKGQVPKRRLINALLRSALSGEPYVTESAKPQAVTERPAPLETLRRRDCDARPDKWQSQNDRE